MRAVTGITLPRPGRVAALMAAAVAALVISGCGTWDLPEKDGPALHVAGPATVSSSSPGVFTVANQGFGLGAGAPCPQQVIYSVYAQGFGTTTPNIDNTVVDNPATHRLADGSCAINGVSTPAYGPNYVPNADNVGPACQLLHTPSCGYDVVVDFSLQTIVGGILYESDGRLATTIVPPAKTLAFANVIQPEAAPPSSNPPGPEGVSVLSNGNVLVADTPNNALESFTPAGVATSPFSTPFTGSGSTFNLPRQAAQVNANEIDVSDSLNERVERLLMSGGTVSSQQDFPDPGGTYPYWSFPRGIDVSQGGSFVAVADAGLSGTPGHVNVFTNSPSWPTFETQINCSCFTASGGAPEAVAFDPGGYLYVANTLDGTVSKYNPTTGAQVLPPQDGSAALQAVGATNFIRPTGLAVDPISGNLFVADTANSRVVVFNSVLSQVIRIISTASGPSDPLAHPVTIAFDKNQSSPHYGDLYVADTYNDRVVHYALTASSTAADLAARRALVARHQSLTVTGKIHAGVPKHAALPQLSFGPHGSIRVSGIRVAGTLRLNLKGNRKTLRRVPGAVREVLHSSFLGSFSGQRLFFPLTHDPLMAQGLLATRASAGSHDVACFRVTPAGTGLPWTQFQRLTMVGGTGHLAHLKLTATMSLMPTKPLAASTFLSVSASRSKRAHGTKSCAALIRKLP